jgi:catechol 2,3-dioxygenase-like lactoylglutathione lyase family enzyme
MFSHAMVGSNDLDKAKVFYDAVFVSMGANPGIIDPKGRLFYAHNGTFFLVSKPIDGNPASVSNGATLGVRIATTDVVDAWHAAGLDAGGTTIEDPPGWREGPVRLYLAYLRDPDGNKLCALCSE